jgi:hypothetical protein
MVLRFKSYRLEAHVAARRSGTSNCWAYENFPKLHLHHPEQEKLFTRFYSTPRSCSNPEKVTMQQSESAQEYGLIEHSLNVWRGICSMALVSP